MFSLRLADVENFRCAKLQVVVVMTSHVRKMHSVCAKLAVLKCSWNGALDALEAATQCVDGSSIPRNF